MLLTLDAWHQRDTLEAECAILIFVAQNRKQLIVLMLSSMGLLVGSFGLSTFSRVFCQVATTPLRTLPPYSLVHRRRKVW